MGFSVDITVPIWVVVLVIALIVVLVSGLVASSTATRLNRMHIRTDLAVLHWKRRWGEGPQSLVPPTRNSPG